MTNRVIEIIKLMVDQLNCQNVRASDVLVEGSPVISFGDVTRSRIATLGLNPSDREFFDFNGIELEGIDRRFHTLKSLEIKCWTKINTQRLKKIQSSCENYFFCNPYDRWFKPLNNIIAGTGYSYYDSMYSACHLDLVPYATKTKWGNLSVKSKKNLLDIGGVFLADTLNEGSIEVLVLNGKSVITALEKLSGIELDKYEMSNWKLSRGSGYIRGEAYIGTIRKLSNKQLVRPIKILGFNHNIQSSFGVTNEVKASIKEWVSKEARIA